MTAFQLILSLLCFSCFDFFQWKYKVTGKTVYSEWYKVFALLTVGCFFWMWTMPFKTSYIFTWILWHYPIQQTFQGTFRMGKPLYLGVGKFDKWISKACFQKQWIYVSSLIVSFIVGLIIYL